MRCLRAFGDREYILTDGSMELIINTREFIVPGSSVKVNGELQGDKIICQNINVFGGDEAKEIYHQVAARIKSNLTFPTRPLIADDPIIHSLWPKIVGISAQLLCAKKLQRPTLLRFHGDADGICSAIAISSFLNCRAYQQNSAVYSVRDALHDIDILSQEVQPLLIFVDFGSSEANLEGIKLIRATSIELIIIDHHPYFQSLDVFLLNPLTVNENSSKYCAGYLCCEIAAASGVDLAKCLELARTACAGDKSNILAPEDQLDITRALVLDFLAAHASFGNKLDFYKNVLMKKELFDSLAKQAEDEISNAAKSASKKMRKTVTGDLLVASFSLDAVVVRGEWPPSSKVTTRIYDDLCSEDPRKPILCIGYNERSIILRINDPAVALGFSANSLAEKMMQIMPDFVQSGGGHVKAGAMRIKEGFVKEVLAELMRTIQ